MTVATQQDADTMTQLYDTSNDPVVQEIPWTIMGTVNRIQVTQSGVLLVEGARIESADVQGMQHEPPTFQGHALKR
jgi:hypothetical protein